MRGGFPCVDVSAAGKRAGMHGTRSGLWSHSDLICNKSTEAPHGPSSEPLTHVSLKPSPHEGVSHVYDAEKVSAADMTNQSGDCATCGEAIPEGQAEFDLTGGRIGLPHHPACLSMPETLKSKISRCPVCGHMEGRHLEVTAFDESTGKIRAQPSRCTCGCDYYLKPRGVG